MWVCQPVFLRMFPYLVTYVFPLRIVLLENLSAHIFQCLCRFYSHVLAPPFISILCTVSPSICTPCLSPSLFCMPCIVSFCYLQVNAPLVASTFYCRVIIPRSLPILSPGYRLPLFYISLTYTLYPFFPLDHWLLSMSLYVFFRLYTPVIISLVIFSSFSSVSLLSPCFPCVCRLLLPLLP